MRFVLGMILASGACLCQTALCQPPTSPPQLVAARAAYQNSVDKAQTTCDEAVKQAAEGYKQNLIGMLEAETKAGNLDSAIAIRDEIRSLEAGVVASKKINTKTDLKKALTGSRWDWGDAPLTLEANGVVKQAVWEVGGLVTKWEAVDRRSVVLFIEKGRASDRIAVLEFSEAINAFGGFDFSNGRLKGGKRLAPNAK